MNIQLSQMMLGIAIAILLPLSSSGQQASSPNTQTSNEIVESSLGDTKNVHQRGNLFFAGQFNREDIEAIKKQDDGHLILIDFDRIEGKSRDWLLGHVRAGKEVFQAEVLDAGFKLIEEKKINGLEETYFLKFGKN